MKRRRFLTQCLGLSFAGPGLSLAASGGSSMASSVQGPRVLDLELFDTRRQRPVPARLYLPAMASAAQPVPLVVFSHGLGGSRRGYSYLARHWAEAGIASLHPQHVGSDDHVWRGNPLEMVQRLQTAAREDEALARVLDLRFALDQVLASDEARLIDTSKMAVAGHSYGANTAMLMAGARVQTDRTGLTDLVDRRMQAAILISAPPLLGQGPAQQVLGTLHLPTLHITSLDDTITLPGYRSTVEDRIAIFEAMARSPRTLAVFNTGGHSIFTDRTTRSGPQTSARIKGATQELCTLFLRQSLHQSLGSRPSQLDSSRADETPAGTPAPAALKDLDARARHFAHWADRHRDVLDRFVTPDGPLGPAASNTANG